MNKEERIELAKKLINEEINRTLERWEGEDLLTYAWGWRNEDTVSSNHHTCFYNYDVVKAIANGLRLNVGLSVGPNCDGNMTPYVQIW